MWSPMLQLRQTGVQRDHLASSADRTAAIGLSLAR